MTEYDDDAPVQYVEDFRHASNGWFLPDNGSRASTDVGDLGVSLTRQEFAADADINNIMATYQTTGQLPVNRLGIDPVYMDLTDMPDNLQDTLRMLDEATDAFMLLPAVVRKEFDNDPVRFVEFASDPNSVPQLREWGLAKPDPAATGSAILSAAPASSGGSSNSPPAPEAAPTK